jgi:hypothetical protein
MDGSEISLVELVLLGYLHLLRDLVHLRIDGRDELVARVIEIREEGLLLSSPWDADGGQLMPVAGTPIEIGCTVEEGTQWLSVVATGPDEGEKLAFGVRYEDAPIRRERRREPRARVDFRIGVSAQPGDAEVEGTLLDVSEGGMRARAPVELETGDIVYLTVHVPAGPPMQLTASVMRADPDEVYALSYGLFSAGSCRQLVELAFQSSAQAA